MSLKIIEIIILDNIYEHAKNNEAKYMFLTRAFDVG